MEGVSRDATPFEAVLRSDSCVRLTIVPG